MKKFKDAVFRNRFSHWVWLSVSTFILGINMSIGGPTFLDLQHITGTGPKMASFFFTAGFCGYSVGAFLTGIVHRKIKTNIIMTVFALWAGCTTIWTPYCTHFFLMLFNRFLTGLSIGGIDTAVNAEHMLIWGDSGEAFLQVIHFMFSVGCSVGPPLVKPFLIEKMMNNATEVKSNFKNTSSLTSEQARILSYNGTGQGNPLDQSWTITETVQSRTSRVRYAFLIVGLLFISISLPFIVMIFVDKRQKQNGVALSPKEKYGQKEPTRKLPKLVSGIMIFMMAMFYMSYCILELTMNFYLMTFVLGRFEQATTADGVYSTTLFWASFSVARFVSIFITKWLRAVRVLYFHLSLVPVAFIGVFASGYFGQLTALNCFTCLGGVSLSAIFPAGFSWMESEIMMVTGRVLSLIFATLSGGNIVMSHLLGYLMDAVSILWFSYVILGAGTSTVIVFLSLLLFNRCYVNKKYGSIGKEKTVEINEESEAISVRQV